MIKKLFNNHFATATFWMFIATGVFNAGNYLYHVLMGRFLGRELYGALESTISVLYIISIPMTTITLVTVKFISTEKGKNNIKAISGYYYYMKNKIIWYGLIATLILIIISPLLVSFLHLPSIYLPLLIAINFFISLFVVLSRGILQGLSNFFAIAISNSLETITKLLIAAVLIFVGLKTTGGALTAIVISAFMGYLGAYFFVKKMRFKEKDGFEVKTMASFAIPVFLTTLALTSLFTIDVVLVRHFFPGVESGDYAALSILGKIIFFAVSPIMIVMFPFVSEHHAKGQRYTHFFLLSAGLTFVGAGFITVIYFLFPQIMVGLLFGKSFLEISGLLGIFGVFMLLYSLCYLFANFYLSIHKTKAMYFSLMASLLQIIGIWFFHERLLDVIYISITATFLLLLVFLLYYPHATKGKT